MLTRLETEDRKKTSSAWFFFNDCLVAWLSKKQNSIYTSIVEAKYIVVGSCCTQLFWMKQMFKGYDIEQGTMDIFLWQL